MAFTHVFFMDLGVLILMNLRVFLTDILSVISILSGEAELQLLELLWTHENMFKTGEVQANERLS